MVVSSRDVPSAAAAAAVSFLSSSPLFAVPALISFKASPLGALVPVDTAAILTFVETFFFFFLFLLLRLFDVCCILHAAALFSFEGMPSSPRERRPLPQALPAPLFVHIWAVSTSSYFPTTTIYLSVRSSTEGQSKTLTGRTICSRLLGATQRMVVFVREVWGLASSYLVARSNSAQCRWFGWVT